MATASWRTPQDWAEWSEWLAAGLDGRCRWRTGMLFAQGRRTVTSWLRAAGIADDFANYYYFLAVVGRKTESIATQLLLLLLRELPLPARLLAVIDDSPTKRYGPYVEGADVHHNPTPGPADQAYLYGHIWVTLSLALRHPRWGALALPLRAMLYVRQRTMAWIPPERGWRFATKLDLAAQLLEWWAKVAQLAGKMLWVVVDGFYAKRPLLRRAVAAGVIVVSRLRKDTALRDLPRRPRSPRRGRPRKYGAHRISLAKRAGSRRGWQTVECLLYHHRVTKTYKTFLATYRPVRGIIRVVLVKEAHGWFALFCTDPNAVVVDILEAFADRATIEQDFHDVKEIWGAGHQQVRNIWTNVGAFNMNLWMHTLVELWTWTQSHRQLVDRRDSPWDDAQRRPSHAKRRKALRQWIIDAELSTLTAAWRLPTKILRLTRRLAALAA